MHHPTQFDMFNSELYANKSTVLEIRETNESQKTIKILSGKITWSKNAFCQDGDKFISKEIIYMAADDAIGKVNRLFPFGVTRFLEVSYRSDIPLGSQSQVEVAITKRKFSSRGKLLSFCSLNLKDSAGKAVQASAEALFIENKDLHNPVFIDLNEIETETFQLKKRPERTPVKKHYHEMVNINGDLVTWVDGYGPRNKNKYHVHGGTMSIPVFHMLLLEKILTFKILYSQPIPMESESKLSSAKEGSDYKFTVLNPKAKEIQFEAFVKVVDNIKPS